VSKRSYAKSRNALERYLLALIFMLAVAVWTMFCVRQNGGWMTIP
jgi:hypothetical protein